MIKNKKYAKVPQIPLIVNPVESAYKRGFADAKYYHETQVDSRFSAIDQKMDLSEDYLSGSNFSGEEKKAYERGVRAYEEKLLSQFVGNTNLGF
jgi:hypothetical protein